jgi:hypothetical protein
VALNDLIPRFEDDFPAPQYSLKETSRYYLDSHKVTLSQLEVIEPDPVEENGTSNGMDGRTGEGKVSMDKGIIPFEYEGSPVRVIEDENGEPWFVAKDVRGVLGIAWKGSETLAAIPDDWKVVQKLRTSFGEKETWFINESAVYKLAFRSNKPDADKFTNLGGRDCPSPYPQD